MIPGLYSAASGMAAHQAKLDVLANNLANAGTPGFKADLITIDPSVSLPNDLSTLPSPTRIVTAGRLGLDLSPGVLRQTGNPLDLAIVGPGLFALETPQGERYIWKPHTSTWSGAWWTCWPRCEPTRHISG